MDVGFPAARSAGAVLADGPVIDCGTDGDPLPEHVGAWSVVEGKSHVHFSTRVASMPVSGRMPLTGALLLGPTLDDSAAYFSAGTPEVQSGSSALDALLTGPYFLDAAAFPEIEFESVTLVQVPTGWRGIGTLTLKDVEYPLACEISMRLHEPTARHHSLSIAARWAIDSAWITRQHVLGLPRRIEMSCFILLEQVDDVRSRRSR